MSSEVQICNLALGHLGDEANVSSIDPPEGSAQADHCAQFYPIARDALLEMHTWGFATKRTSLALLTLTPPDTWLYAYTLPASCLKIMRVRPPMDVLDLGTVFDDCRAYWRQCQQRESLDNTAEDFVVESQDNGTAVLYTNVPSAIALYVVRVKDTNKFTSLFKVALARLLASYLAGPVIKGTEGMKVAQAHMQMFLQVEGPQAKASDSNARKNNSYDKFQPSSISARN